MSSGGLPIAKVPALRKSRIFFPPKASLFFEFRGPHPRLKKRPLFPRNWEWSWWSWVPLGMVSCMTGGKWTLNIICNPSVNPHLEDVSVCMHMYICILWVQFIQLYSSELYTCTESVQVGILKCHLRCHSFLPYPPPPSDASQYTCICTGSRERPFIWQLIALSDSSSKGLLR